jgi:hypothetical protein
MDIISKEPEHLNNLDQWLKNKQEWKMRLPLEFNVAGITGEMYQEYYVITKYQ